MSREDEDAPEVVSNNAAEMEYLRSLHESSATATTNKQKRKPAHIPLKIASDKALDEDVLAALANIDVPAVKKKKAKKAAIVEEDDDGPTSSIDIGVRSTKIGNITVTMADEDETNGNSSINGYIMSDSALEFSQSPFTNRNRVSYSRFSNQKKKLPAKNFAGKRNL